MVLAFIGDAVHTLFVRQSVLSCHTSTANQYNKFCSKYCSAVWQSGVLEKIRPILTEQEEDIVRRGRNVKTGHSAKNATLEQYQKATGFEALVGFLHLTGQFERLEQLLKQSIEE